MLRRLSLTIALGAVASPAAAQTAGQSVQPTPPAYVAAVDGVGFIERDRRTESSPLNMPLVWGDRIRTTEGRMEIRFADGSTLDLDARTIVDLQSDTRLRLMDGRIRVTVRTAAPAADSTCPSASSRSRMP